MILEMGKILFLEFDKGCTLEEIKEEMLYYEKNMQTVSTIINGITVISNDPKLEQVFERLSLGLTEEEYTKLKTLEKDNTVFENRKYNARLIEEIKHFRFYYGLAKTLIKPEKIDEFEEFINCYGESRINNLILATQIMLAFENENILDIYKEVNKIIMGHLKTDENKIITSCNLDEALWIVERLAIKGYLVDQIFFKGTTENYKKKIEEKISINKKKIKQIKEKNK